jgi:hypothetical protein
MGRIVVTEYISVDGVVEAPSRIPSLGRVLVSGRSQSSSGVGVARPGAL